MNWHIIVLIPSTIATIKIGRKKNRLPQPYLHLKSGKSRMQKY